MSDSSPRIGIFLMAHGAPESTEDIPEYLKQIRGGKESTPETIQIIRDRYEQIGGSSPLREITAVISLKGELPPICSYRSRMIWIVSGVDSLPPRICFKYSGMSSVDSGAPCAMRKIPIRGEESLIFKFVYHLCYCFDMVYRSML